MTTWHIPTTVAVLALLCSACATGAPSIQELSAEASALVQPEIPDLEPLPTVDRPIPIEGLASSCAAPPSAASEGRLVRGRILSASLDSERFSGVEGTVEVSVVRGEFVAGEASHPFALYLRGSAVTTGPDGSIYRLTPNAQEDALRDALLERRPEWLRLQGSSLLAAYVAGPHGGPVVDGVEIRTGGAP